MVVAREVAVAEFEDWAYNKKRIKQRLIEGDSDYKDAAEKVINNIMDGTFTIDENGYIAQKLAFSLPDGTEELRFKPHLNVLEMQKMKNAKAGNEIGKLAALISTLSDVNTGIINKMDSTDMMACTPLTTLYMVG